MRNLQTKYADNISRKSYKSRTLPPCKGRLWEMKANFEFEETWDVHSIPIDKQKLDEIKKQKPEETKKVKNKNLERAKKLGRTS